VIPLGVRAADAHTACTSSAEKAWPACGPVVKAVAEARRARSPARRGPPAVQAQRYREGQAASGATEAAQRSEIMRLHREARLRAMLAPLTEEQHAEAEQFFWERAQLEDVALVAQ
jgi:hypothetical protein